MSNRDSMGFGDLLPQDVVDIFAHEKHSKRPGKKRSHSLGRALGWLKGKKRKDLDAKGQGLGLGPALDLALDGHPAGNQGGHKGGHKGRQAHPQGNGHAAPKRDDDDKTPAPPQIQENVFIEASRPEYLENLHTEALEGLKMMQQEETNHGVEFQDNESTITTMSVHTDGEGGGFMTDSTIADTTSVVSVQSSVSSRSSRSGLTRQGSTFRPLNSGQKPEKTRTRRKHRKTDGGIPQHVQREMGLDRAAWSLTQRLDEEQPYNGETEDSPTTDGPPQAAESQNGAGAGVKVIHPLNKDQLEQLGTDLALLRPLGPDVADGERPHSLAVPWMTTANGLLQEPPSPVMTMSPQAAYMSKIIPNAVLPPSIDVVEISRGRSRNSVRTVSKSSLLVSSPSSSRASSRASKSSTMTSASRHPPDSSGWSNSESSDTLVSDSSTISSSSTPRQRRSQNGDASAKEDKISVHSGKASRCTSNGKVIVKGDKGKKEGSFARSLSVMKPKRAPPPPNRSYSLHNKMKRRSRDLAELRINSREASLHNISGSGEEDGKTKPGAPPVAAKPIDSPGYHGDTSSLDDSTGSASVSPLKSQVQALKAEEAAKAEKDASPEKKEKENKLSKITSPSSGYSSQDGSSKQPQSASPRHKRGIFAKLQRLFPGSTHAASTASPLTQPEELKPDTTVDTSVSPSVRALRELFNIPPPPHIRAPPPPPPEVWAHSRRSVELLLGPPVPDNLQAIIKKNPKDRRQQRQSPCASTEGSVKVERKHKNPAGTVESANGSVQVLETKKVQESGIVSADRLSEQNVELKENSKVTEKFEKGRGRDIIAGMLVKAVEKRQERLAATREEDKTQVTEVKTKDTLPAISLVRMPPSPSPPPGHLPPNPPTKQTTVVVSPESSWPPPPPPMAQADSSKPDEIDFPLPPPPMFGEVGLVLPVQVPPERSIPGGTTTTVISVVTTDITPPLNIPPPPPYTAPPPPVKVASPPITRVFSPLPTLKEVSPPPPPPQQVSPPPPPPLKEVSPPPPPPEVPLPPPSSTPPPPEEDFPPLPIYFPHSSLPIYIPHLSPPKEVSPPPPKEVSPPPPPPPVEIRPPPQPKEVSPLPPVEVSPPPPVEVPPPPQPKEVSAPPPPVEVPPPSQPKEISAPPPPVEVPPPPQPKEVSAPPPPVEVPPPPQPKEVSAPPPPVEVSAPPPPVEVSAPPPPEEVPPPPQPKEVSAPPPPVEVPPPPQPKEVSVPLPPVEVPPPPQPKAVSAPPPPVEVPPPPQSKEVLVPLPPVEVPPPPQPKEVSVSLPPVEVPPPPQPKTVSAPPPPVEVPPPPQPKEVSAPPPPVDIPPPPQPKEVSAPPPPVEVPPPPQPKEVSAPPPPQELSLPKESSPPLVQVASPPLVNKVSPLPPKEVSPPLSTEEATPVCKLTPPESIPPPPPTSLPSQPKSSEQEVELPQESVPSESETVSPSSILTVPQSIPPPPPVQVVTLNTDGPATQEASPPPPAEVSVPPAVEKSPEKAPEPAPVNVPLPVQDLASTKDQPSPASTETPELTSAPVVQEEPSSSVTPSLLQMVKLRSGSISPEPPKAQEPPEAEVTMRKQQPSDPVPTSSPSGDAPQKPIRRSLIIISPPPTPPASTSPPAIVTEQQALPKSQSIVLPPTSTSVSPTKKSPPGMTSSPSMNLQEAIRLRTAARSKDGPGSRLSLHSPTSPKDLLKSPTSTASFIFSKSNKRVVIETKPAPEPITSVPKVSSVTKIVKVPPPVAKKPKSMQDSVKDAAEKTNGTAGTVEGGTPAST